MRLIPQARAIVADAQRNGRREQAQRVTKVIDDIVRRPEHEWLQKGAEEQADAIKREMERKYGRVR